LIAHSDIKSTRTAGSPARPALDEEFASPGDAKS
jgi:hypothetical protein